MLIDPKPPQGTPAQPGQGDAGDAPEYITAEQLNRAISARFGEFQKKIEKSFEGITSGITTTVVGQVKELLASTQATPAPTGDPKGANGIDIENSPVVKGLQRQLAEHKAATEKLTAERDAEKASARDQKLRSTIGEHLTKSGFDPKHIKAAIGNLIDVEKRVRFADDSDDIVFRDEAGDVDISTGLKGWSKSDDAKIYLPPRGTQGAGDRSTGRTFPNGQTATSAGAALLDMARIASGDPSQG